MMHKMVIDTAIVIGMVTAGVVIGLALAVYLLNRFMSIDASWWHQ